MKIVHFADAHIDMAAQGRHDPVSGLPVRVLDFLKALDTVVDTAIDEHADLVIFAGDAYKDRTPAPTFQREWGRRIMRLSQAGIPTVLLVGNHDLSPAAGRAHALQEFETFAIPHVHVIGRPAMLGSQDLEGLPLQIIGLPWISRSGMMAAMQMSAAEPAVVFSELETRLGELVAGYLESADPALPIILTAHASVQGALYGAERAVMLGGDLVLSGSLVKNPRLSYVALGHIHKAQDLNEGAQPPVIYPGSIERVDFGEAADDKYFVIAHVEFGKPTLVEWRKLEGRRFFDRTAHIDSGEFFMQHALAALPSPQKMEDAIVRLVLEYPRPLEPLLDEQALREYTASAFEFHLLRRPQYEVRVRIQDERGISSLSTLELLDKYWEVVKTDPLEAAEMQRLAKELLDRAAEEE
jgi:DNA repair protein SbcD/Mre11